MSKMKAAVLVGFGGVDQLEVREVPEPETRAGDVKVRVVATSVNPIDWKLREGMKRPGLALELPAILGRDAAGEVVEVGAGVTRLRVGMRVAGLVMGGYAERVVAPEPAWAEVPASLDLAYAAVVPLVALTGSELVDGVAPRAGDVVLVTGAVGSVGRVAVFVARSRGAKVWAGVRSSQRGAAAALGVEGIVALDDASLDGVPELDAIVDTAGPTAVLRVLERVRAGGKLASVVGEPPEASARGLAVQHVWARPDHERLAELLRAVAEGKLTIPIARTFTLGEIREAHRAAQEGASGKVVVRV